MKAWNRNIERWQGMVDAEEAAAKTYATGATLADKWAVTESERHIVVTRD